MTAKTVPIADVQLVDRHRSDFGDLAGLARSITENGLIQPIVITPDKRLIAGQRRLEACKFIGWTEIDVHVIPIEEADSIEGRTRLLVMERDENTCRKEMTAMEKLALGRALEALEVPKAKERQTANLPNGSREPFGDDQSNGRVRDIVGPAVGLSGASYQRLKTVVAAAENPASPEPVKEAAREAIAVIDAGGSIRAASDRVAEAKQAASGTRPARRTSLPASPQYGKRRSHLEKLEAIATGLSGYQVVLAEITELDGSIGNADAARLRGGIREAVTALNRINGLLLKECNP